MNVVVIRRTWLICCVLVISSCLVSCGKTQNNAQHTPKSQNQSPKKPENESQFPKFNGVYSDGDIFVKKVKENPIDKYFERENMTANLENTQEIQEYYSHYFEAWDNEMKQVVSDLSKNLHVSEKEDFLESQKGWETYYEKDIPLSEQILYDYQGGGTDVPILIVIHAIDLVRNRTLTLAEYEYTLTGNYEFKFKPPTKK